MSHTKGKLAVIDDGSMGSIVLASDLTPIGHTFQIKPLKQDLLQTERKENARRLVACWNACEGSSTEWLEFQNDPDRIDQFGPPEPFQTRYTMELQKAVKTMEQRDQLLAAIKRLASAAQNRENTMGDPCALLAAQAELRDATKVARAAIAAAGIDSNPPNTNKG